MPCRSARNRRILKLIAGGLSPSREIAASIGATRAQAYQALLELEARGHIQRSGRRVNLKGPPSILWSLHVGN